MERFRNGGLDQEIISWIHNRKDELGIEQSLHAQLAIFQEDIMQMLVAEELESIVKEFKDVLLKGELGTVLRPQPEATKDFFT